MYSLDLCGPSLKTNEIAREGERLRYIETDGVTLANILIEQR